MPSVSVRRRTNLKFNSVCSLTSKEYCFSLQSPWLWLPRNCRDRLCDKITLAFFLSLFCCSIFKDQFRRRPERQLIYYTTFLCVCQEVFQKFFRFFSISFFPASRRSFSWLAPRFPGSLFGRLRFPSARLIYHFFLPLSTPFLSFFSLPYTWSGVSTISCIIQLFGTKM